jgi:hypothetical protein
MISSASTCQEIRKTKESHNIVGNNLMIASVDYRVPIMCIILWSV